MGERADEVHAAGVDPWLTIGLGLAAAFATGALVGIVNGLLIAHLRIAPFVTTLATMGAAAGFSLVLTGGVQIAGAPREVILLGNAFYFGVLTVPVIVVLAVMFIAWAFMSFARFGRWTYAIGSNSFAARAAVAGLTAVERHRLARWLAWLCASTGQRGAAPLVRIHHLDGALGDATAAAVARLPGGFAPARSLPREHWSMPTRLGA